MKEVYMNDGEYISYTTTKKSVTIDDDISINLQKREEDDPVMIDVYYDRDENLMLGYSTNSQHMVAQIGIPAREYTTEEVENPDYNADAEESSMNQKTITKKVAVPFDIDNCTIYLFAL